MSDLTRKLKALIREYDEAHSEAYAGQPNQMPQVAHQIVEMIRTELNTTAFFEAVEGKSQVEAAGPFPRVLGQAQHAETPKTSVPNPMIPERLERIEAKLDEVIANQKADWAASRGGVPPITSKGYDWSEDVALWEKVPKPGTRVRDAAGHVGTVMRFLDQNILVKGDTGTVWTYPLHTKLEVVP